MTLKNYSWAQYLRNIYTFQLWDVHYEVVKWVELYKEPVPIISLDYIDPELIILPGNVIEVTGTWEPDKGDVSWLAVRVFKGPEPVYGYVLAPNGSMDFFGGYMGDDEHFRLFNDYDEDKYKLKLAKEFYSDIIREYAITIESDPIEKQKIAEYDQLTEISHLIADEIKHNGVTKYSREYYNKDYYCRKGDYKFIKEMYNWYFEKNYYPRLLDIFDIDGGWKL